MRTIDGIEVIDAIADETIEVTAEDIAKAVPRDPSRCALAVAWKRGQTNLEHVLVYKSRAFKLEQYFGNLRWFRLGVSQAIKVQEAIIDNGGQMSPGIYTFKRLRKSQRTGQQQGGDKDPNKSKPTVVKTDTKRHIIDMRRNASTSST
jgi:hypothetical protein